MIIVDPMILQQPLDSHSPEKSEKGQGDDGVAFSLEVT